MTVQSQPKIIPTVILLNKNLLPSSYRRQNIFSTFNREDVAFEYLALHLYIFYILLYYFFNIIFYIYTINVNEINGSHPCNKPCVYCNILRKTESNQFKSNSNGQTFNIRQNINGQSENVVCLIWCEECKLQGVGHTLKMNKRLSNYCSHIKQKRRTCSSVNHFIDKHANNWKDVLRIMGIVKLTNLQEIKKKGNSGCGNLRDIGK